ncbi:exo-beta-N-acetylmuramidase NamZ domain-containing protein [Roseivirga sp. BDSF3-8]|uniref:exo-beta-N-acetylmuramidase NamZ family protein n=1 Tax=Roseivirga sp. BDSF3-8 TaxID=3241598 RepID=UPI0035324831
MRNYLLLVIMFLALLPVTACAASDDRQKQARPPAEEYPQEKSIMTAAARPEAYIPLLEGKNVAVIVNQTSTTGEQHLVDLLLEKGVALKKIMVPEHGFRGTADAGEKVQDGVDPATGLPVISLYGSNKKPSADKLADIDVVVFDLQDVGVRFYTYISTMHYALEACAENGKKLVVLDRPNPNGMYIDGPILKEKFRSFVGMHPIPVLHGLTVGELARMINGEGWLAGGLTCELEVVPVVNYSHDMSYTLPVKPSPNLPNDLSIQLYPSLCFFEGTPISVARGTVFPFQAIGYPEPSYGVFTFTPKSIPGMAKSPKLEGKTCYGIDFRNSDEQPEGLDLTYLIDYHNKWEGSKPFFTDFFNLLAGTDVLAEQIKQGFNGEDIRMSWQEELQAYKEMRKKYLLYK